MKITVRSRESTFTIAVEEEAGKELYSKVVQMLLDWMGGKEPHPKAEAEPKQLGSREKERPEFAYTYSGFLYMECPSCGEGKAFCTKEGLKAYTCPNCQTTQPFTERLKLAFLACECGKTATYHTNATEQMLDISCVRCGNPVAMEYSKERDCYEPIKA